jgi:hypothetical protein
MYKLPVWQTIKDGYSFIWAERRAWLGYALGPILVIAALLVGIFTILGPNFIADPETFELSIGRGEIAQIGAALAIFMVVNLIVYISFTVAWHRLFLIDSTMTSPRELLTWRKRHWIFLLRLILVALISMIMAAIIGFLISLPTGIVVGIVGADSANPTFGLGALIGIFFNWLAAIILTYVLLAGLLLSFPAAAVEDDEVGFGAGWRMAKGNRWRMFAIVLVGAAIPTFILTLITALVVEGIALGFEVAVGASITVQFVSELFGQAITFLGIAIGVSMLSIIYRRMRDNVPLDTKESA